VPAVGTHPGCVFRTHVLNPNTSFQSLILDKALELEKGPGVKFIVHSLAKVSLPDTFQGFHYNNWIRILLR